jgi:hypothetical protein
MNPKLETGDTLSLAHDALRLHHTDQAIAFAVIALAQEVRDLRKEFEVLLPLIERKLRP